MAAQSIRLQDLTDQSAPQISRMDRKAIWQVRGTSSAVFQRPTIRFVTRTHRTILCIYDRAPTDSPLGQKGSQIHSNEDPNKGKLRLFLDSASLQLWEHWASSRLFYGENLNLQKMSSIVYLYMIRRPLPTISKPCPRPYFHV